MSIEMEIKMNEQWQNVYTAMYNELRGLGRSPKLARIQASRQADISLAEWLKHERNGDHD